MQLDTDLVFQASVQVNTSVVIQLYIWIACFYKSDLAHLNIWCEESLKEIHFTAVKQITSSFTLPSQQSWLFFYYY